MILFDTETTGLPQPGAVPLNQQPQIIEFAAIKVEDKPPFKIKTELSFLCKIVTPLPDIIIKITKLTDADLVKEKSFAAHYPELVEFFLGERFLVAHNVKFDIDLLRFELLRIGKLLQFPWPPNHICTVQSSLPIKGYRLKLGELYSIATGKEHKETHRALPDVYALYEIVKNLIKSDYVILSH